MDKEVAACEKLVLSRMPNGAQRDTVVPMGCVLHFLTHICCEYNHTVNTGRVR